MKKRDDHFYQRIVEEALNGILVFSLDTQSCVFANPVAKNLLLWNPDDELAKKNFLTLTPEMIEHRVKCFSLGLIGYEGFYQEVLIKKSNGSHLMSNLGVKHFVSGEENFVLLMIQDITLQKKLQRDLTEKQAEIHRALENLKLQNSQLKDLDVAKNRFIALVTHELRTPLSAMLASAEVLQMGLYDDDAERQNFINMLVEQGRHLSQLVNDVLDFAKIQAGKMDYYIQAEDLWPLVVSRFENYKQMAANSKIKLSLTAPANETSICYFDAVRLQQVLDNVIANAIKYNTADGFVRISSSEDDKMMVLHIEDSGRGIAPDQIDKIFDEFETLGRVALHHQGTGLGMPISRRIIESMGGAIKVKSVLGKGSTFSIEIPKHKVLAEDSYRSRLKKAA